MMRQALVLAWSSMRARRLTAALTVISLLVSVALVLSVNQLRSDTKAGFSQTLSGADLIVGARSGDLNLLLYSVFRIGAPLNNMSWERYDALTNHPNVAWTIPLSLGDSYRGYRVVGTSVAYFEHYRYADNQRLEIADGRRFANATEAVIGADVAADLALSLNDTLIIAHGIGATSFQKHKQQPLTLVGVLARTGTPVDQAVHVPLTAIDRIHGQDHRETTDTKESAEHSHEPKDLSDRSVTAAIVGLTSRVAVLQLQREINQSGTEPLSAIIPGVTLRSLWEVVGSVEQVLLVIAAIVVIAGLLGLLTTLLMSLNQRASEMAILRSVGAPPTFIATLLVAEAIVLSASAAVAGALLVAAIRHWGRDYVLESFGLYLGNSNTIAFSATVIVGVILCAMLLALLPAALAYHRSLSDGLRQRH